MNYQVGTNSYTDECTKLGGVFRCTKLAGVFRCTKLAGVFRHTFLVSHYLI